MSEDVIARLSNIENQLSVLQGFIHKLFGQNFDEYCAAPEGQRQRSAATSENVTILSTESAGQDQGQPSSSASPAVPEDAASFPQVSFCTSLEDHHEEEEKETEVEVKVEYPFFSLFGEGETEEDQLEEFQEEDVEPFPDPVEKKPSLAVVVLGNENASSDMEQQSTTRDNGSFHSLACEDDMKFSSSGNEPSSSRPKRRAASGVTYSGAAASGERKKGKRKMTSDEESSSSDPEFNLEGEGSSSENDDEEKDAPNHILTSSAKRSKPTASGNSGRRTRRRRVPLLLGPNNPIVPKSAIHEVPMLVNGVYFRLTNFIRDEDDCPSVLVDARCSLCFDLSGKEVILRGAGGKSKTPILPNPFLDHLKKMHVHTYNHYLNNAAKIDALTKAVRTEVGRNCSKPIFATLKNMLIVECGVRPRPLRKTPQLLSLPYNTART